MRALQRGLPNLLRRKPVLRQFQCLPAAQQAWSTAALTACTRTPDGSHSVAMRRSLARLYSVSAAGKPLPKRSVEGHTGVPSLSALWSEAFGATLTTLNSKVPKGFGRFFDEKDGNKQAKKADGKRGAEDGKENGNAGAGGGQGGGGDGDGGSGGGGGPENMTPGQQMASMAIISLLLLWLSTIRSSQSSGKELNWQEFRNEYLATGKVKQLDVVNHDTVRVVLKQSADKAGGPAPFFRVGSIDAFQRQLEDAQIDLDVSPPNFVPVRFVNETDWMSVVGRLLPTILIIAALFFVSGKMSGGAGGGVSNVFKIGKANPATLKDTKTNITFADVAGCDEAKKEIMEFVSFLKDPSRFTKLGAKIPKGALLVGPPGTGKTLLAKATAGEASVPFFSMSGSDFIEMFVGVGPSRVRDLFSQAREKAPCIVFIDEIDAVARARGKGGFSGGNDERENTLNQLLVEMDGFQSTEGVVVLAGTNRADILDKAILRPGRFDRQIQVDLPDIEGRKEIFKVHLQPLSVAGDIEKYAERMAALTPGFAGADIANICNEAAILAARAGKDAIGMKEFENATDRVIGGLEKSNNLLSFEERKTVAYHEAGHAIAGWFLEHADPLLKVTIVPRGKGALGFAQYLPKEVALLKKEAILDKMCMALGGRVSEEINFGCITTGAADDLDKVTQMAYSMVTIYGMNEAVGTLSFPPKGEMEFNKPYSDATAQLIDDEVRKIVDSAYERTKQLLTSKKEAVQAVAELLLKKETINQAEVKALVGERPYETSSSYKAFIDAAWEEIDDQAENEGNDSEVVDKDDQQAESGSEDGGEAEDTQSGGDSAPEGSGSTKAEK